LLIGCRGGGSVLATRAEAAWGQRGASAPPTPRTPLEAKGKEEEERGERRKKREEEEGAP